MHLVDHTCTGNCRQQQLYQATYVPCVARFSLVCHLIYRFNGGDPITNAVTAAAVLDSPNSTGTAWVGLLLTAQKYALRALLKAPALCAWDVAGAAVQQLLAMEVGWRLIPRKCSDPLRDRATSRHP